jgi:hypothetical protein
VSALLQVGEAGGAVGCARWPGSRRGLGPVTGRRESRDQSIAPPTCTHNALNDDARAGARALSVASRVPVSGLKNALPPPRGWLLSELTAHRCSAAAWLETGSAPLASQTTIIGGYLLARGA